MTISWAAKVRLVEARAQGRCEYCRMHQSLQGATFHTEHTHPRDAGGSDDLDNLAWSCPRCNLMKSDRQLLTDPLTGMQVPLFNPRKERWDAHFAFAGYRVEGITPVGRAMVLAFDFNHDRRIRIRRAEELFGLFPPRNPDAMPLPKQTPPDNTDTIQGT